MARIAVVDDDEMVAMIVALAMQQQGHEALLLDSAESLLSHPDTPKLDLILLDLNMTGMTGLECLGQLKDRELAPNAEIIVLTASHDNDDILRAHWLGASGYIVKPFDTERLVHQLGGFSARHRLTGLEDEVERDGVDAVDRPSKTAWAH